MDMRNLFCANGIGIEVRRRLLKCDISSVLTYGCESWTNIKVMERRLEATEIWFYRKMLRLSWVQKVTNEVILEKMKVKKDLLNIIRAR